jgi:hypothetical protein
MSPPIKHLSWIVIALLTALAATVASMKAAESPIHATTQSEGARHFTPSYLLALAIGALGVIALFGVTLVALEGAGRLPPPQFANNLCIDEKLRFLRSSAIFDDPAFAPEVLAVGSSVTWRTLDGEAVERATSGRARFFNGGFCGLKVNETAFTMRYFLERYPSVREVVTVLAPQDLTDCRASDTRVFDAADVDRYVYGNAWVFPLYLKYFDPFTFAKNVALIANKDVFRWNRGFDRFASLPMDTTDTPERLVYGKLDAFDPACFEALRDLAVELRDGGRRLIVATMPMNPAWVSRYDPQRRLMWQFTQRVREALAGTTATLWDSHAALALRREDFLDAIHIRWSAARNYSRALVRETGLGHGQDRAAAGEE